MRLAALALLAALLATAPAAAATPTRTCSERSENGHPTTFGDRRNVTVGALSFTGLKQYARRGALGSNYSESIKRYRIKTAVVVRAGRVVTLSIAPASRSVAQLEYAMPDAITDTVRITSCDSDEPAFSYDGPVGPATAFPGGFILKRPACVGIVEKVGRRTYRRTLAFGKRRCG